MAQELILIAAIGRNNELGKDGKLIYEIPEDMKHFRKLTMGHSMIMGRKTFESLPRVLPGRQHVVLTSDTTYTHENPHVFIANSLDEAFQAVYHEERVFVIGGGDIYEQLMPQAHYLMLTKVDDLIPVQADTYFPEINKLDWELQTFKKRYIDGIPPYGFYIYKNLKNVEGVNRFDMD